MKGERILVARLKEFYWPSWLEEYYIENNPVYAEPIEFIPEEDRMRVDDYHERRVRFFMDAILAREPIEPIQVESKSEQYRINSPISWGAPEVVDGHHRYVAAVLLLEKHIYATFGGVMTTLSYLKGKRKTRPLELRV